MKKTLILYSLTSILILFGILVLVNLIASNIFIRFDLTQGKVFSLSKASKKLISRLPDKLNVKAYFSKNLPPEYATSRKYLEDLLGEYKVYSRGKISYEFIDPLAEGKEKLAEVQELGIQPLRFTQVQKDKYEVQEGYMGVVFIYGDKKEIIPVVKTIIGIEYDISSVIKKIISPGLKTVGFTTGHGDTDAFGEIEQFIRKQYDMHIVDMTTEKSIPEKVSALLVVGPKNKFTDKELFLIDQFLLKGKPVAFLIDKFKVDLKSFYCENLDTGLDGFLEKYGVKISPEFVMDLQCKPIQVRSAYGYFTMANVVNYVLYPVATKFDETNLLVKGLGNISMLFTSPVEITPNDNLDIKPIIFSSEKSWARTVYMINPYTEFNPRNTDKKGPFNLAVVITPKKNKTFTSYFADKPPKEFKTIAQTTDVIKESGTMGRIFVAGNSNFAKEESVFFLNLIDWLSQDEDLISIRSKGGTFRPLKQTSSGARIIFKYSAIFLLPLLVIAYGIFRWKARAKLKNGLKGEYA